MSRAAEQPIAEQARHARDCVLAEAAAAGKRPSVLAVARRSGLSNTTFRRHFPDIARELSQARRTPPAYITSSPAAAEHDRLVARNARLRRDNQQLRQHLQPAIANIQRLTLEARQLRTQLEAATSVTRIGTRSST